MGAVCTKKSNKPKKYTATQTTHLIPKDGVSPRIIDNSANSPIRESNLRKGPNSQANEEFKSPLSTSKRPIEAPIIREFPPLDDPKLLELKNDEIFQIEIDDTQKNFLSISIEPEKRKLDNQSFKQEEQQKVEDQIIVQEEIPQLGLEKNDKNEEDFDYEAFLYRNVDYKKEEEEKENNLQQYEEEEIKDFEFIQAIIPFDHNSFGGLLEEEIDFESFFNKVVYSDVKDLQPIIKMETDPFIVEEEFEIDDYLNDFNKHEDKDRSGREMNEINETNEMNEINEEEKNNIEEDPYISNYEINSDDFGKKVSERNSENNEDSFITKNVEKKNTADVRIDVHNISNNFFRQLTSDNLNDDMGIPLKSEGRKSLLESIKNDSNLLNDEDFEFENNKESSPQSNIKYSLLKSQDFRDAIKGFSSYEGKIKLVEEKMKKSFLLGNIFAVLY